MAFQSIYFMKAIYKFIKICPWQYLKINVQLSIKVRKFLYRSCYWFYCSLRTCIMWKQVNWFLIYMAFTFTCLVSLWCWFSLEIFLNSFVRFVVNFFVSFGHLFCSLTQYLKISCAITFLFLSVPYSLCFAINLKSLFYPNEHNILLMMATWIRQEHSKN